MFLSDTRLPHLLPPASYWSPAQHQRERDAVFAPGWHVVGTIAELARSGDFLACELLGQPIQVRNFDGTLHALSNVCAHRHCLLTSKARGHSERMRCQYHGWEYGCDGATRHIPQPKHFVPFDSQRERLPAYRVSTCGQLVFVSLDPHGPELQEHLGSLHSVIAERFGARWQPTLAWNPAYEANWKVPVENSLEAYHVPSVHPHTFREDPGEPRSQHTIEPGHTSFRTRLPFSAHSRLDAWYQRCESRVLRSLGVASDARYEQHHVFPNLLFSFTDAISLCHCVTPTGPNTAQAIVRQFGRTESLRGVRRQVARLWGKVAALVTRRILQEDMVLYPAIQRGLETSPHRGVLGRCEERIHAFQHYLHRATSDEPEPACCGHAGQEVRP